MALLQKISKGKISYWISYSDFNNESSMLSKSKEKLMKSTWSRSQFALGKIFKSTWSAIEPDILVQVNTSFVFTFPQCFEKISSIKQQHCKNTSKNILLSEMTGPCIQHQTLLCFWECYCLFYLENKLGILNYKFIFK